MKTIFQSKIFFTVLCILSIILKVVIIGYLVSLLFNAYSPSLQGFANDKGNIFLYGIIIAAIVCSLSFIIDIVLKAINYFILKKKLGTDQPTKNFTSDSSRDEIEEIRDDLNAITRLYQRNYTSIFEYHKLRNILNDKLTRYETKDGFAAGNKRDEIISVNLNLHDPSFVKRRNPNSLFYIPNKEKK